jgi:NAD(P)-dependent dehydrogenase (short-subunit alcohol dehydrogenase family)
MERKPETVRLDQNRRGDPRLTRQIYRTNFWRRTLVTGATAGIGQETAKLFARRGASVIITGRDTERGAQTVAAIEAEGGRAEFIAADLNDIESVRRLAEQAGEVDVLVNNAGAHTFGPTLEQDVDSFDMTFHVDVRAPFFLTAALVPKMIARGSGAIVNISTMGASVGVPFAPVAAAAKAALESLTRSWAAAFGANGIRVNTVAPGPTRTDSAVGLLGDGRSSGVPRHCWAGPRTRARSPRRSFSSPRRKRATSPARPWRWTAATPRSEQTRKSPINHLHGDICENNTTILRKDIDPSALAAASGRRPLTFRNFVRGHRSAFGAATAKA